MADKMTCPACDAHLSDVLRAFNEGRPCPSCGLPASAAEAIIKARKHHVEEETLTRLATAETRLAEALSENRQLRSKLDDVRAALDEPVETLAELSQRERRGW
jgi:hypothetical protein